MKKIFLTLMFLALATAIFAQTLATINGKIKIDSSEVDGVFGNMLMRQGIMPSSLNMQDPQVVALKKSILENLIKRELLYMSAQNNVKGDIKKSVDAEYEKIKKTFKNEQDFQKYLNDRGLTEKEIKDNIGKNIILQDFVKSQSEKVNVSDKEIKEYYEQNKAQFKQQEQVRASHIIILTNNKDEKKAEETINKIYKEIKGGLDFAEAAKKYSEDGSAQQGGDLGYFSRGKMVQEFEDEAFKMNKDEISKPFKSRFGYHILKVTDKKPEKQLTYEEVKEDVKNIIVSEKTKKLLDDIIEKNRLSAKIEYAK
ncbi:peptidylprolyl isomerase [Deferribacterales bacterium Es71-Z0220]|jgi:parvulin-like peptidyl-prolyl isomerase|uniref:peptidylprolyl isomerase n=1 Tax=Deferrivibrio essentukiensis TaxID=2880922 RepID=UPI001F6250A9|nr:peptidylprolyl isomerase [Deferrivibrio essentukiensis]MBZ4672080.1 PpiC-type peptidyl-prolyl cis-trans isomerase [Deferribacteraceae bacterium]MCB4204387.1 peptidylprolyl isomerase [Deferrivibrio essentukiensis]